jgi:hypothetical protein
VQRGRGVPALMVVRHPEHASADRIAGAGADGGAAPAGGRLRAVQRGELTPRRFLERHAWSPYRGIVAAMEAPRE